MSNTILTATKKTDNKTATDNMIKLVLGFSSDFHVFSKNILKQKLYEFLPKILN